jgi:deaminated glutathione amidase
MRTFVAAAVQTRATADPAESLARALPRVDDAIAAGAELIVLPEGWSGLGDAARRRAIAFDPAAPEESAALSPLCARSRAHAVAIVAGGIPEMITGDPQRTSNTLVLVAGGRACGFYRKVHLFDAAVPGAPAAGESAAVRPGDALVVLDTWLARLGASICYDLRFPALYGALAAAGAEVMLVPSAFTLRTGMAHWEPLLRARAIENGAWVIAAAQHGAHGGGRESYGHSMIVDPWGTVVAQASGGDDVVLARIGPGPLEDARRRLPTLQHRRDVSSRAPEIVVVPAPISEPEPGG